MVLTIRTRPSFPHWGKSGGKTDGRVSLSHQEASISLYPYPSEGKQDENHKHRKLIKLITCPTSLANSMKQWATPRRATQDGQVMVESSDKIWSTGKGNGKTTSVFLPWESREQCEKAKRYDTERWTPQVSRCPICYWRRVEKQLQKEWRARAKAKTTPSCGCDWWWK